MVSNSGRAEKNWSTVKPTAERASAQAVFSATPTPASSANGYRLSRRLGFTIAFASGESVKRLMMVGYHYIHAHLPGRNYLGDIRDTAVDRDHEPVSLFVEILQFLRIQTMAFRTFRRQKVRGETVQVSDCLAQRNRRGHAIQVLMSPNQYRLFLANRVPDALHGRYDIGQVIGRVKVRQPGVQVAFSLFCRAIAPGDEYACEANRNRNPGRQLLHEVLVCFSETPHSSVRLSASSAHLPHPDTPTES